MTPGELAAAIAALRRADSELSDVEAKAAVGGLPKSVRAAVSAFANTNGGTILLGVDEDAGFSPAAGLDVAQLMASVGSMLADEFEPPVRALISPVPFEGHEVVVVEVPAISYDQRPCFHKPTGMTNGSWTRTGASNRRLTPYEVQLLVASRGQPRDDERPVAGTSLDDLDQDALRSYVRRLRAVRPLAFSGLDDFQLLRRCGVVVKDSNDSDVLSLAGLLALGAYPQQWFPQLNLTFVHLPDDSTIASQGLRFLDNVSIDGPIPVIVRDAIAAITRNLARRSVITGAGRSDVLEYPEPVIREALVNALVHRDLSQMAEGTQVQVELYPSRLVVRNPGGLHGPVTVDQLFDEGISSSRNARLLRLLEDVPISGEDRTVVENRGSGVRAMAQALRSAGMNLPTFDNQISRFTVTFPNHTLLSEDTVRWIESLEQRGLTDSQIVALARLRSGELLDNQSYRGITGADSRVATAELQDLVGRELVEQRGERRWATYSMPARVARDRRRLNPADRRDEILRSFRGETLAAKEIADRTGIPVKTVRHWLKRLRDEGRVRFAAGSKPQSNQTRYEAIDRWDGRELTLFDLEENT